MCHRRSAIVPSRLPRERQFGHDPQSRPHATRHGDVPRTVLIQTYIQWCYDGTRITSVPEYYGYFSDLDGF